MDEEGEDVELHEGMAIETEEGEPLGTLASLLVGEDDEEEEAEFLLLDAGGQERLVPFDAVLGVNETSLVLDVPKDAVARFPVIRGGADPTDAECELAWKVYEDVATYEEDDEL